MPRQTCWWQVHLGSHVAPKTANTDDVAHGVPALRNSKDECARFGSVAPDISRISVHSVVSSRQAQRSRRDCAQDHPTPPGTLGADVDVEHPASKFVPANMNIVPAWDDAACACRGIGHAPSAASFRRQACLSGEKLHSSPESSRLARSVPTSPPKTTSSPRAATPV